MEIFKVELKQRLSGDLPAHLAHQKLMKHRLPVNEMEVEMQKKAKKSAVLILLYPKKGQMHLVFIRRAIYDGVHSGQIALPGGKFEPEDRNLQATAFREAAEELNIKEGKVELLGKLSPLYVPPSNYIVHPFVGLQEQLPIFKADPEEVDEVIECPLHHLLKPDALIETTVHNRNKRYKVKAFQFQDCMIWGATAMIVKELTELLEGITWPNELK